MVATTARGQDLHMVEITGKMVLVSILGFPAEEKETGRVGSKSLKALL
jgi:hypothetical protein